MDWYRGRPGTYDTLRVLSYVFTHTHTHVNCMLAHTSVVYVCLASAYVHERAHILGLHHQPRLRASSKDPERWLERVEKRDELCNRQRHERKD